LHSGKQKINDFCGIGNKEKEIKKIFRCICNIYFLQEYIPLFSYEVYPIGTKDSSQANRKCEI
jgi:hypothetical protein